MTVAVYVMVFPHQSAYIIDVGSCVWYEKAITIAGANSDIFLLILTLNFRWGFYMQKLTNVENVEPWKYRYNCWTTQMSFPEFCIWP